MYVCMYVYSVSQGAFWSSVYDYVQEGTVAMRLSFHVVVGSGMCATEVDKEVIQLFRSMRPDRKSVFIVMETVDELVRPPC
jgi:hypothetical protein